MACRHSVTGSQTRVQNLLWGHTSVTQESQNEHFCSPETCQQVSSGSQDGDDVQAFRRDEESLKNDLIKAKTDS